MLRIFHCIFWVRAFLRHYYYYYFSTTADFRHTEFKIVLFFNSEWQYRWKDANICIFCCFHYENGKKLCTVFLPSFWQNYTYDIVLDFVFCSITVVIKWTLFLTNWYPLDSCFWRRDLFILTGRRNSHNDFSNKEWDQTYCVRHLNFKCHSVARLSRLELWKPDEGKPVQQRLGTLIKQMSNMCTPSSIYKIRNLCLCILLPVWVSYKNLWIFPSQDWFNLQRRTCTWGQRTSFVHKVYRFTVRSLRNYFENCNMRM